MPAFIRPPAFYEFLAFRSTGKRGFYVTPRDDNGQGWGEPFEDQDGKPINPGTPGGPNQGAFLAVKANKFKSRRARSLQRAGNIDWKGNWVTEEENKRDVITWDGPNQRYWNNGAYIHGEFRSDHYIYYNGLVIAIAPYPVLGCAFCEMGLGDDKRRHLLCVVKNGQYDELYVTEKFTALLPDQIDDDTYDLQTIHSGDPDDRIWTGLAGSFPPSGDWNGVAPEAPWFFNVDGTEARTMRRCTKTHGNLNPGENFKDEAFLEMRLYINAEAISGQFQVIDTGGFVDLTQKWVTTIEVERLPTTLYTQPAIEAWDGFEHYYDEAQCTGIRRMEGKSKVAVDYDPERNLWVYGWIEGNMRSRLTQNFTINVDTRENPNHSNPMDDPEQWDVEIGPLPFPNPKPSFSRRYKTMKLAIRSKMTLKIGSSPDEPSGNFGSLDLTYGDVQSNFQFSGDTNPETEGILAFVQAVNTFPQYLDLRTGMLVALSEGYTCQTRTTEGKWDNEKVQILWSGLLNESDFVIDDDNLTFYYEAEGFQSDKGNIFQDWDWIDAIPQINLTEDANHWSYSGTVSDYNFDGADMGRPGWNEQWGNILTQVEFHYFRAPSLIEYIGDRTKQRTFMKGVVGSTEKKEHLVALEYTPPGGNEVSEAKSFNVDGDAISAVNGGTRLSPGGVA